MTQRVCLALTLLVLLALGLAPRVAGHATLVESDPADGATITTPYTVTATFAEEIDPQASTLLVESSGGEQVAEGTVDPDEHTRMTAYLPALPEGEYTVRWTSVTPGDNGVERGTFRFSVAAASSTPSPQQTSGDTIPGNELLIALVLAGIAIGGILAFVFLRSRR